MFNPVEEAIAALHNELGMPWWSVLMAAAAGTRLCVIPVCVALFPR